MTRTNGIIFVLNRIEDIYRRRFLYKSVQLEWCYLSSLLLLVGIPIILKIFNSKWHSIWFNYIFTKLNNILNKNMFLIFSSYMIDIISFHFKELSSRRKEGKILMWECSCIKDGIFPFPRNFLNEAVSSTTFFSHFIDNSVDEQFSDIDGKTLLRAEY